MYLLAADGLFSWIQFSTDRIKQPLVIVGLMLIAIGSISALIANPVNNNPNVQSWEQKNNKSDTLVAAMLRIGGYMIILLGCILAAVVK